MKPLFSLDSGLMQFLGRVFDMMALNVVYLLCCLPVFTIGAAQAGLMNAMRVFQDKEDDSSVYRAFFRGFTQGFGTVSLVWCALSAVIALLGYILLGSIGMDTAVQYGVVACAAAALTVCAVVQIVAVAFHSRFSCTPWQLLGNAFRMIVAYLLRSVVLVALVWAPVAVLWGNLEWFIKLTPFFLVVYYSAVFYIGAILMRAPFRAVEEAFLACHQAQKEEP